MSKHPIIMISVYAEGPGIYDGRIVFCRRGAEDREFWSSRARIMRLYELLYQNPSVQFRPFTVGIGWVAERFGQ